MSQGLPFLYFIQVSFCTVLFCNICEWFLLFVYSQTLLLTVVLCSSSRKVPIFYSQQLQYDISPPRTLKIMSLNFSMLINFVKATDTWKIKSYNNLLPERLTNSF